MSGIAGVLSFDGNPIPDADLPAMLQAISRRGEHTGFWCDGEISLGSRTRLNSPEPEIYPIVVRAGELVLVADARIDNRDELMATTGITATDSHPGDGALILAAYQKWGESAPEHLIGDFAFALWDGRKHQLLCARDHMGTRPFHYHHNNSFFAFGSELRSLFALEQVHRRISEARIADYLASIYEDCDVTFYEGILRLPPAHTLSVTRDGVRLRRYWSLDPDREIRLGSDQEYAEGFRELFIEAVRCRLRGTVAVGSTLSGGLDSSSVASVARNLLVEGGRGDVHTFSAVFDDVKESDEREYIDAVLNGGGMIPHFVYADRLSPLHDFDSLMQEQDEPYFAPNLFMHRALMSTARRSGVGILLDGVDGDSTVSHGLAYLVEMARTGKWIRLYRELGALPGGVFPGSSRRELLRRRILRPLLLRPMQNLRDRLKGDGEDPWIEDSAINPDFANRLQLRQRYVETWRERYPIPRTQRGDHLLVLQWPLHPFILEVLDKAAATEGIESRYPFFDRRLMEYSVALPPEQKLSGGWSRMVLRRGMEGILPSQVQWRKGKSNLGHNFHHTLGRFEQNRLDEFISNPGAVGEYADMPRLRQILVRFKSNQASEGEILALWKGLTLWLWLRRQ